MMLNILACAYLYIFEEMSVQILCPFLTGVLISESFFIYAFCVSSLWNACFDHHILPVCDLSFPYAKIREHRSWIYKSSLLLLVFFVSCLQKCFWTLRSENNSPNYLLKVFAYSQVLNISTIDFLVRFESGSNFNFFSINIQLSFPFHSSSSVPVSHLVIKLYN